MKKIKGIDITGKTLSIIMVAFCLTACPEANINNKSTNIIVDQEKTKTLFDSIVDKKFSEPNGVVSMSENAIYLHPSKEAPTEVTFDVTNQQKVLHFTGWISTLPDGAPAEVGVVGVEFYVDGTSVGRSVVDRSNKLENAIDLNGKKSLRIVVDSANNTDSCDWFHIGIFEK